MRSTDEVWLEIVRERLNAGDAAPVAIGKAQLVTNAYAMRFEQKPDLNIKPQVAQAYPDKKLSELSNQELLLIREEELKLKHEQGLAFNPCTTALSDPNARES